MPTLNQQLEQFRVLTTLRATLVLLVCVVVSAYFHLQSGMPILMSVIILVFFLHDESISAGLQIVVGALLGAVFGTVLIDLFLEARPVYLATVVSLIGLLAYWAAQGLRGRWPFPFIAVVAMFVVAASAFGAIGAPALGDAASLDWAQSFAIGVAIIWTILIGFWPAPRLRTFEELWLGIQQSCADLVREIADLVENDQPVTYRHSPLSLLFFGVMGRLLNTNAWRLPRSQPSLLITRLRLLNHIYLNIRAMARALESWPTAQISPGTQKAVVEVMRELAHRLEDKDGGSLPIHIDALDELTAFNRRYAVDQAATDDQARVSAKLGGFAISASLVVNDLNALHHSGTPTDQSTSPPMTMAEPHGFRLQPDSLKAALKMMLGISIGLSIHFLTTIPAGSYLMLGMVIVLVQPNLGKSHIRMRLTGPGMLFGTLYSLVGLALISLAPHFGLLLILLALGFLIGGYYSAGPDRVAFGGIQFTLATVVVLGMAAFPIGTLTTALDRALGAVLGFTVAFVVGLLFWPEHPANQLRANVARNLRKLPATLDRLCAIDDPDPDKTLRELHQLKLDVQSDFGLLYDFSYMLTTRIRPSYDYQALVHAVGSLFLQTFTLYEVRCQAGPNDRPVLVASLNAARPVLNEISAKLADHIAAGRGDGLSDLRAQIGALAQDLAAEPEAEPLAASGVEQWRAYFGRNAVREILHQLRLATECLQASPDRVAPKTAVLAQTYEGAR